MKIWLCVAMAALSSSVAAQQASPTSGNADRGKALLSLTGPSSIDLMRMTPLELQQYRCDEVRQKIQMQLDMSAAGSTGYYSLSNLRALEDKQCNKDVMDMARQRTEGLAKASAQRAANIDHLEPGKCDGSIPPRFPPKAIREKHQGQVVMKLVANDSRRVISATVLKSSGFAELDQAGVEWGMHQRCNTPPGTYASVPLNFYTNMP